VFVVFSDLRRVSWIHPILSRYNPVYYLHFILCLDTPAILRRHAISNTSVLLLDVIFVIRVSKLNNNAPISWTLKLRSCYCCLSLSSSKPDTAPERRFWQSLSVAELYIGLMKETLKTRMSLSLI